MNVLAGFLRYETSFITFTEVAKQVLDHCVIRNPNTQDPNSNDFALAFDFSFVEDHQDEGAIARYNIYVSVSSSL